MKTKISLALFSLFVFLTGCTSLQTGGEVQSGRQALLEGKNEAALGYFYSAAQMDPDFPRPGKTWNGRFPPINKKILPGSI